VHVGADRLPLIDRAGASVRVITGHAFGATAPVPVFSSTLYCAITLQAGASLEVPDEHPECAVLVAEGAVEIDGSAAQAGELAVLTPGVASSRERIEAGKVRWSRYGSAGGSGQFPPVPGDAEFIPLPPR
jgi:redox-sensitive bicupin YhaK (pirin superfamily)